MCTGSDSLFLGTDDGYVNIIGKSWKVVRKFQAHETGRITHMKQVEGTSLLVTVAVSSTRHLTEAYLGWSWSLQTRSNITFCRRI